MMSKSDHEPIQHTRLNCKPNTPDKLINAFKKSHRMIFCFPRGCQMSLTGCRKLRKKSGLVKQFVMACRLPTVSPSYLEAKKCLECRRK